MLSKVPEKGKMKEKKSKKRKKQRAANLVKESDWLKFYMYRYLHQQRQIHAIHSTNEHKTEQKSAKTAQF